MRYYRFLAALVVAGVILTPIAAPAGSVSANIQFAQGLNELTTKSKIHDPHNFQRLLKVELKNAHKWSGQPNGTSRWARWRTPKNTLGILEVVFNDTAMGADTENNLVNQEVSFSADIFLSGTPCVHVAEIERGFGLQAQFSNVVFLPAPLHGPIQPFKPTRPDKRLSFLDVKNTAGYPVTISLQVDRPGHNGCLRAIGLQSIRSKM